MILKPGARIGAYEIIAQIGAGGMGVVWKALDTSLSRHVAIKLLPPDLLSNSESRMRFQREAQAAAALDHPNIAVIHQVGEQDDTPYIVMQLLEGKTLRHVLRDGQLPLKEWLRVATAMANGLAHAHKNGIVHRDLKPDNVMITTDQQVKILDFGLAKVLEPERFPGQSPTGLHGRMQTIGTELTRAGQVFGTVSYMSPEQARGEPMDQRSDLFSCGILLYEMAAGRVPFRADSLVETLSAIISEEPPPLGEVAGHLPAEAERVVRKAMEKEPDRRYQRADEMATDLRNLERDLISGRVPIVSGAVATPHATRAPRRSWRLLVPAAIALALAAIALYSFWPTQERVAAIGAGGRPAMAVMPFDNPVATEETQWLSHGIPNMLLTALAQAPGLDVISSQRLHEILAKMGSGDADTIEKGKVLEVARKAGAGAVVAGSIFQVGPEMRIDVQVEEVGSGRLIFAHSVTGREVFPLVDRLAEQIRSSLHLEGGPTRNIADITSESVEAYRSYLDGIAAMDNLRAADARDAYLEAVEIDPTFAMAYYELSIVSREVGDAAAERENLQKAVEHLDRLPERERLLVEAGRADRLDGRPDKAIDLLERLIAGYPDEVRAYSALSSLHQDLAHQEEVLDTLARGTTALPNAGALRNAYAYALLDRGRYADAVRELETYAWLEPDEPNPHDSLGETYLITGQPEKALESYARSLEADPSFFSSHSGRAWARAMLGNYDEALDELTRAEKIIIREGFPRMANHFVQAFFLSRVGRYREAEQQIVHGAAAAELVESVAGRAYFELLSALLALEREDDENARRAAGRARQIGSDIALESERSFVTLAAHVLLSIAEVRSMRLDVAHEHLAAAGESHNRARVWERWTYHCLEGELALAMGESERARASFVAGEPDLKLPFNAGRPQPSIVNNHLPCRDWKARVSTARGDLPGAIDAYRDLLEPDFGQKWTAVLEPRYVLELARLLEQTGDRAGARDSYGRFLELWKNADPGSPPVEEARAAYAKLQ